MTAALKKRLSDLRPNTTIRCVHCEQTKSADGAVKFHSCHVCADCVRKLEGNQK